MLVDPMYVVMGATRLDPDDPSDRNGHDLHRRFTNLEMYLAALAR